MNDELSYSWRGEDGGRIRINVEPSLAQANVCLFIVEPALYRHRWLSAGGGAL